MPGTLILTGANSSLGFPAVEHLLSKYPKHTAILTVRNDSESDLNTQRLRAIVARFPNAKATIRALDLANLSAVHAFADQLKSEIATGQLPPLEVIVANAYYWNLVGDPEITADGFDKTIQVAHISHSALILRLLGNFGPQGRIVLISSDSHWPGKNSMEKYPPVIPDELEELIKPSVDGDKQGRGYQRYATSKLAMTTWMYALNRYLEKDPALSKISAVAMNPGNMVDSRALTTNTPIGMHRMQKFMFKPLLPVLKLAMGPTLRTTRESGPDVIEMALNQRYAGKRGFFTLLQEDQSSPASQDKVQQEALWRATLKWARITPENTALEPAFRGPGGNYVRG